MNTSGAFVVTWQSQMQDGSPESVFAQRFDASAVADGDEFQVNVFTPNSQIEPAVSMDDLHDFVVVWTDSAQDGDVEGVFGQHCAAGFPDAIEVCDGIDNDCDPATPDGAAEPWVGAPCDGVDSDLCEEGVYSCTGGVQTCSDSSGDDLEVCDNADNDCNLATSDGSDEAWFGADCDGNDSDLCNEGIFACTDGTQTCTDNTGDLCDNARLSNISTRGRVGTLDDVLIGGFIISGGPKKVLVRARGPEVVPGFLQDPMVRLTTVDGDHIFDCDDWLVDCGSAQAIIDAGQGFEVDLNELDAAFIITLPDGLYTAIVSGVGGTTGIGMVEIIELP